MVSAARSALGRQHEREPRLHLGQRCRLGREHADEPPFGFGFVVPALAQRVERDTGGGQCGQCEHRQRDERAGPDASTAALVLGRTHFGGHAHVFTGVDESSDQHVGMDVTAGAPLDRSNQGRAAQQQISVLTDLRPGTRRDRESLPRAEIVARLVQPPVESRPRGR